MPKQSWVTDNALYALTFDKRFILEFLIHYLSYVDLNQYANRAAQPVISLKRISTIKFPLIEKDRQKAFIEILEQVENGETHFGDEYSELNKALKSVDSINELQTELSFQLTQIENLNQAILQEAVQGKLVKQDPKDESAGELLKRIKAEKAKSGKKEKPLPPIKPEEIPFEIPENWEWCRLGEIFQISSGDGLTSFQMCKTGTIPVYGGNGINGYHNKANIEKETIVIGRVGYYCGCVHLTASKAWVTDNAFIVTYSETNFDREFLIQLLKWADLGKQQFAGSQPVISGMRVYPKLIPLPPLSEQKRIVAEIEKQLAKTKQLKEHIIANQQATEQLLKALLHQAFEVEEK